MNVLSTESSRIQAIWGNKILDDGFTPIPNLVLRNYRKLNIEHGEWGFICILMSYKHDHKNPYPHQETIAKHLNVSVRQVRKWTDSLVEKGLLQVGRRMNRQNHRLGSLVYNFEPLLQRALELANHDQDPLNSDDDETVIYDDPFVIQLDDEYTAPQEPEVHIAEPQVPFSTEVPEPQVTIPAEPQVPLMNRTRTNTTTSPTVNYARTSTNQLDNDPYAQIELAMMTNMGRPYIAKQDDYLAIKRWLTSQVPLSWIIEGIHRVFANRPGATIRSFKYVSTILEEEWAKEIAKKSDVLPFDFKRIAKTEQNRHSKSTNLSGGDTQRDERYANFYNLFPDA